MNDSIRKYFYEISAIPRPSGKEDKIADYLMEFAKAHGLSAVRDEVNNVLIRKSANGTARDASPVLLQGHTDMVCEKNNGTVHDFLKEGIKIIEEGDFLRADGTTLGADNGYAVAVMLSLLSDTKVVHPPLECLFTTAEETGLDGMQSFDKSLLTARAMINLDSCDETVATAASAGGMTTHFRRNPTTVTPAYKNKILLSVTGLAGGHSGEDINSGRKNALKLCTRLYLAAANVTDTEIVSVSGGNKDNAIPRECSFAFTCADPDSAEVAIRAEEKKIREILAEADHGFTVTTEHSSDEHHVLSHADKEALVSLLRLLPYGPIAMSNSVKDLVETSSNMAIVHAGADGIEVISSSRSSLEAELDDVSALLSLIAKQSGFDAEHKSRYPGWAFNKDSRLQEVYLTSYRNLFGTDASIIGIHAGLECGLVKEAIPDMDILSIGPNMYDIHTPDERLSVSSAGRVYDLLLEMLRALGK